MSALLGMQINQVMLALGIGLFVFVMVNRIRRGGAQSSGTPRMGGTWRRERASAVPAPRAHKSIGSARLRSASASPDHETWDVEMHRLARELKAEIDTKMRALEQLIQLADEARIRLDASIGRAESPGSNGEDNATTVFLERTTSDAVRFTHAARRGRAGQGVRNAVLGARGGAVNATGDDPRFERVYALADAGFSATKIASQIGTQVSEVELILSLRQSGEAA